MENGDTLIHKNIKEVVVVPPRHFESKRMQRRYNRFLAKVKKVYPLAVEAKELLKKYEPIYNKMEDKRDKRKLMKSLEKELLAEHKDELENLVYFRRKNTVEIDKQGNRPNTLQYYQGFQRRFQRFFLAGNCQNFQ